MDINIRNNYLLNHEHLINAAIRRNWCLLKALKLETDDVFQELAMAMLKAIDGFNPSLSSSMDAHITARLQFAVLDLKKKHKPAGMTGLSGARVTVTSIESCSDYEVPLEIPDTDDGFDNVHISEAIATLNSSERDVLSRRMDGFMIRGRDQVAALESAFAKIRSFYAQDARLAASW